MRLLISALLALTFTGHASSAGFFEGLDVLREKHESVAFEVFGNPTSRQHLGKITLYVWSHNREDTYYPGPGARPVITVKHCTIKLAVVAGLIKRWDAAGNPSVCEWYMKQVKTVAP